MEPIRKIHVPQKKVHHDAVTHTEEQLVSEAYDEPVNESTIVVTCNGCGATFGSTAEWSSHNKSYALNGDGSHGSYSVSTQQVISGYIHHDAVYQTVTIVDTPDYYETVTTGC